MGKTIRTDELKEKVWREVFLGQKYKDIARYLKISVPTVKRCVADLRSEGKLPPAKRKKTALAVDEMKQAARREQARRSEASVEICRNALKDCACDLFKAARVLTIVAGNGAFKPEKCADYARMTRAVAAGILDDLEKSDAE